MNLILGSHPWLSSSEQLQLIDCVVMPESDVDEALQRLASLSTAASPVLADLKLLHLQQILAAEGRPALLNALKAAGVFKVGQRQAIANAVAKSQRASADTNMRADAKNMESPYPAWLVSGSVPRLRWDDDAALQGYFARGEPVVITGGCPFSKALVGRWNFEYLSEHLGEAKHNMHFAPRHVTRFSRFYGKGLGKGGVTSKTFKEFVVTSAANEESEQPAWRFYTQGSVLWANDGSAERGGGDLRVPQRICLSQRVAHGQMSDVLVSDLNKLDWRWLEEALGAAGTSGFHSATLWAGHGGGCTPMHYDALSNFFTQLVGRKRVLCFLPSQWPFIYPYPSHHPMDTYAQVDVEAPDLERFPALRRARGLECTLEPGDVLWLPSYVYHHVRQLDAGKENLSMNCWCGTAPQRVRLGGATLQSPIGGGRARAMEAASKMVEEVTLESVQASAASALLAACDATKSQSTTAAEEEDERRLVTDPAIGLQSLFAVQYIESKVAHAIGAERTGPFLSALAAGGDAPGGAEKLPGGAVPGAEKLPGGAPLSGSRRLPEIGRGTPLYELAVNLRVALVSQFGVATAGAFLRACTRHGRVYPGPPAVGEGAEIVNSEAKQHTPEEEVARMLASGEDGRYCESPFLRS